MSGPEAFLRRVGTEPDETIDIAEAALALAALDHPDLDLAPYRRHLATLADDVEREARGAQSTIDGRIAALQAVLAVRHGYRGDGETYDDMANADLIRVVDRRRGLPVALGILYLHAARSQGWPAHGLNFPGHFLIRVEAGEERAILDPFDLGRVVDTPTLRRMVKANLGSEAELEPQHCTAVENRAVLLRLQNNIKSRALNARALERADAVIERMVMIAPDVAQLWRELGMVRVELGRLGAACSALSRCAEICGNPAERRDVLQLVQDIRRRLN